MTTKGGLISWISLVSMGGWGGFRLKCGYRIGLGLLEGWGFNN